MIFYFIISILIACFLLIVAMALACGMWVLVLIMGNGAYFFVGGILLIAILLTILIKRLADS